MTYKATINFYLLKDGNPVIPECLRLFRKHVKKYFDKAIVRQIMYDINERYGFYLSVIFESQVELPKLKEAEVIVKIHDKLKPMIDAFKNAVEPNIDHYMIDIEIK